MSKFIAMLPDEGTAEEVTKKLGSLKIDNLDWSIVDDENRERILPGFAWPVSGLSTGAATPVAPVVVTDSSEAARLENDGVDDDNASYFGRAIEHGGTAIVVEAPDDRDDDVRATLQAANADRIVKE